MACLGMMGGISFGVRIALLRAGLIFGVADDGSGTGYILGWAMIAVLGILGGLWIILPKFQRSGTVRFCFCSRIKKKKEIYMGVLILALCLCRYRHFSSRSRDRPYPE